MAFRKRTGRRAAGLGTLLIAPIGLVACADNGPQSASFLAMRRVGAEIVEVESSTGRVVRTIVDLGGDPEAVAGSGGLIDGIDLAADGQHLYFSRYLREPGVVYRVRLPDGEHERVADGHGASVSPDGQRLALIRRADLVVRDLTTGQERVFAGVVGELGGAGTAWAGDSRRVAVEILGADVSVVNVVDTQTGETSDLQPMGLGPLEYRVISPAYRPSDGMLSVVCCHTGQIVDGEPPQSTTLVLHDFATGAERSRMELPGPARDIDWDPTGSELLLTDGDRVRRYSNGRFSDIPNINEVVAVTW
jgi:hypothetical protein